MTVKDFKGKLGSIASQQGPRLEADRLANLRDLPDTEARLELADVHGDMVRGPTRAEVIVTVWQALLIAPIFVAGIFGGPLARLVRTGALDTVAWLVASSIGLACFITAVRLVFTTMRPRHVEHVRVRVLVPGDFDTRAMIAGTIFYVLAGTAVAVKILLAL